MKSVLISIRPKWCELIASGKKTIEVRKTTPNLLPPFKCYIYCTKGKSTKDILYLSEYVDGEYVGDYIANGKIIGEFVCEKITYLGAVATEPWEYLCGSTHEYHKWLITEKACLSESEILQYGGPYGWHISNLIIYDKPKKLSDFNSVCKYKNGDGTCPTKKVACSYQQIDYNQDGSINLVECGKKIERPPQSWCRVEEKTT